MAIYIKSHGDVNIHNHCPPDAPGNTCLPPMAGRKQKSSPALKLQQLAKRARVPSVLAASTLQLVRRQLAGKPAANELECAAFKRLDGLPASVRSTLACAVAQFDSLPTEQRKRLFDSSVVQSADDAVNPAQMLKVPGNELAQRASLISFGVAESSQEERPGSIRVFEPEGSGSDVEFPFAQLRICSVNSLRTQDFIPPVSPESSQRRQGRLWILRMRSAIAMPQPLAFMSSE